MLPPWRLALARYKASPLKTPRTLSKLSERSVSATTLLSFLSSLHLFSFDNMQHLSSLCADSLLGFLRLWRNGRDRGMAAGRPTHLASDTWTQSQFQLERNANARLMDMLFGSLSFGNPELLKKIFIFNPHCYKSSPTTKKRNDKNTSGFRQRHHAKKKKKKCINWSKCIHTHCSGMREYSLCRDHSRNELQIGRWFVALPSTFHFLAQSVEVLREIWIFLDGFWWIRFYAMRRCHKALSAARLQAGRWRLCALLPSHTLWQELDERDLYHRTIFPHVRNYYLTCSYDPSCEKEKKKAQKKCWQSDRGELIFIVSGAEVGSLWYLFYSCKCHIIKWFF